MPRYLHFTQWNLANIQVGATYETPAESSYWAQKRTLGQLDRVRADLGAAATRLAGLIPPGARVVLSESFLGGFPEDVRGLVRAVHESSDPKKRSDALDALARAKLEWEFEKEEVFEAIRQVEFSHAPSRSRCMFAIKATADAKAFAARYGFCEPYRLIEVEPVTDASNVLLADMGSLNFGRESRAAVEERARRYWAGVSAASAEVDVEVLIEGRYVIAALRE
jgi:hypothetical protein